MPQTLKPKKHQSGDGMIFQEWLDNASSQLLDTGIASANLDAELLLSNILGVNRTYLHAHPEQIISTVNLKTVNNHLADRLNRKPVAYIIGYQEFYGRKFFVTPATLIPRPESEDIITMIDKIIKSNDSITEDLKLVDVGTGSGCLGITAKLEFPALDVTLTDISDEALKVATLNAKALSADVATLQGDLLQSYDQSPNIIVANLPYVDKSWDRSPETNYEPALALFADESGLSIIKSLIIQASAKIAAKGYAIIEADLCQHDALIKFAKDQSFNLFDQFGYVLCFTKN